MRRTFVGWYFAVAATLTQSLSPAAGAASLQVTGSIRGPDGGWDYVYVDAAARRLYVARGYGVMAVNLADGTVIPVLAKGQHVHGVLPLPGGTIMSTNEGSSTATLFAAADGTELASFPAGHKPDAIAYDRKTKLVAVMNGRDGTVTLIEPARQKLLANVEVGGTLEYAEGDGQGRIYINVKDRNELAVLDVARRTIAARYPLPQCVGPSGLALDVQARIALAVCDNGKAVALSMRDGHMVAALAIGEEPDAAIFDAKHKRFLVPCGGNGVLDIIGERSDGALVLEGAVPTAKGARTGALDPDTGKIYLPTADFEPRKPGEWQGAIVPGSFRVLVVSARQ